MEVAMENYQYRLVSVAHSQAECGHVAFILERTDGGRFVVSLSTEDAQRLLNALPEQVRIATDNSN